MHQFQKRQVDFNFMNFANFRVVDMKLLTWTVPGKLISRRGDWPWPPRSPALAILNFFFWGYIKHKMWEVPPAQEPTTFCSDYTRMPEHPSGAYSERWDC